MSDDMPGSGEVRIPAQKVYEEVLGMKESLSKIEAFMEKHVALQQQTNSSIETRLENHGTRLGNHDTDITGLQTDVRLLKDASAQRESRRAPWWSIVGSIIGIVTGVGAVITMFVVLTNLAEAYQQFTP